MRTLRSLLLGLLIASALFAQAIVIQNARIIDGTGAPAQAGAVVIEGDRITAVGPDAAVPQGARVIDASGQTLLPGLFDLHTHLRASAGPVAADWGKNLETYLASGVTSVDDFSVYSEMLAPMRHLLAAGVVHGPRVHMATRISPPGGHGTESGWGDMFTLEAATPEQAHAVMHQVLANKDARPDVIKVFTDGWRYGTIPNLMSMNEETIAAIVADAHAAGIKVLTHTVSLENAKITIRAGVDSLVHGIQDHQIDDEFLQLIKAKGSGYTSTLAVYEPRDRRKLYDGLQPVLETPLLDALQHPKPAAPNAEGRNDTGRQQRWQNLLANDKRLFDAGVTLGNGTDAGMPGTFHGWAALREMELKVQAGLTPLQAIQIATLNSAKILGVDKDLGTIRPGKLADLVLIAGKPDENIADIHKTARVFLAGHEFDPKQLERDIQSPNMTALPSHPLGPLVDDFERADGRTELGTLRVDSTDPGIDNSKILFTRITRTATDHALGIQAQMGPKAKNFAAIHFPLTPGAIELADLSKFQGISFDVRGDQAAQYSVHFDAYGIRNGESFHAPVAAGPEWRRQQIAFSSLTRQAATSVAWTGKDIRDLSIELAGPPLSNQWLEIDNVRFY